MSTQTVVTKPDNSVAVLNEVITKGNLATLSEADRVIYYKKVCESVGLNPLTKPFEYITLNSKLVLYALRAATDQLRAVHRVSVEELTESEREGVFIVTAKVRNGEGRTDIAKGAVNIIGLKGEALANALMKAETKAKRRATLSICGLGMLDETEVETIPGATKPNISPTTGEGSAKQVFGSAKEMKARWTVIRNALLLCKTDDDLQKVFLNHGADFYSFKKIDPTLYENLVMIGQQRRDAINASSEAGAIEDGLGTDMDDDAAAYTNEEIKAEKERQAAVGLDY